MILTRFVIPLSVLALLLITFVTPSRQGDTVVALSSAPTSINSGNSSNDSLSASVNFHEISLDLGIDVQHHQSAEHLSAMTETLGAGVCVLDANQDGWMDVFLVGGSGHNRDYGRDAWWNEHTGNRLLLNQGGEKFIDATEAAGLTKIIWGFSCGVGDVDNDHLDDIVVAGLNSITLYRNTSSGIFTEHEISKGGRQSSHWPTGISLADFDGDGLLDFYVSNYLLYQKGARTFEQSTGFQANVNTEFNAALYNPEPNLLFKNRGNLQFVDVAEKLGVANALGRSLAAQWVDLNQDQWLDLLVINEASPNQVFINHQGKAFKRAQENYEALEISDSHGIAIGDIDRDGTLVFLFNRLAGMPPVLLQQAKSDNDFAPLIFTDTAWANAVAKVENLAFAGWASVFADFNNDGHVDIFTTNGGALPDLDSEFVSQAQGNQLFVNKGTGQYLEIPDTTDKLAAYSSRGVASLDIDNDGYLELIVANNNERFQVFKNVADKPNNWIGLLLKSPNGQADIYGSHIDITTATRHFSQQILAPLATFSQSDSRLHFGLMNDEQVEKLTLRWRDGSKQSFKNLAANRYYLLDKEKNTINQVLAKKFTHGDDLGILKAKTEQTVLLDYVDIVFLAGKASTEFLSSVWNHSDNSVRLEQLNKISQQWRREFLPLVKRGIDSDNKLLRLKALEILQQAELEISVAWLLPLLFDQDADIQCKVSSIFQFFFQEEEALTHRKYLAVPYLIRLLGQNSDQPNVQVCAIQALAAAENKRAIYPLMNLAEQSTSLEVQVAAITALGLIRDTLSLPLLKRFSSDSNIAQTKAPLIAASFIARARLADSSLKQDMEAFFLSQNTRSLRQKAETLASLYQDSNSIVFNTNQLNYYLDAILNQSANTQHLSKEQSFAIISAIEASKNPHYAKHLKHFLHQNNDKALMFSALTALVKIGDPALVRQHETLIFSIPQHLQVSLVANANQRRYPFSLQSIERLLKESVKNTDNSEEAVKALTEQLLLLAPKDASRLLAATVKEIKADEALLALLSICSKKTIQWLPELAAIGLHGSKPANAALLQCSLQNLPETRQMSFDIISELLSEDKLGSAELTSTINTAFLSGKFSAEKRQLILDIYTDTSLPLISRSKFLIAMADKDEILAKWLSGNALDSLQEDLLPSAINALANHGVTDDLKKKYTLLMKNPNRSPATRLTAAKFLALDDADKIHKYIQQAFVE